MNQPNPPALHFCIGGPAHGYLVAHDPILTRCVIVEDEDPSKRHNYRLMRTTVMANGGPTQRTCDYFVHDLLNETDGLKLINKFENPSFVDRVMDALPS